MSHAWRAFLNPDADVALLPIVFVNSKKVFEFRVPLRSPVRGSLRFLSFLSAVFFWLLTHHRTGSSANVKPNKLSLSVSLVFFLSCFTSSSWLTWLHRERESKKKRSHTLFCVSSFFFLIAKTRFVSCILRDGSVCFHKTLTFLNVDLDSLGSQHKSINLFHHQSSSTTSSSSCGLQFRSGRHPSGR